MTGTRVTVHRIDADPADVPEGPAFERIATHSPMVDGDVWKAILAFLPPARLRTHVSMNVDAWQSDSEILIAIADCPETAALLDRLPADGWLDHKRDWTAAQAAEQSRADGGGPTILSWHRPLVRLGVLLQIEVDGVLPTDAADRLRPSLGDLLVLKQDAQSITLVARGTPQDIEARIATAMAIPHPNA